MCGILGVHSLKGSEIVNLNLFNQSLNTLLHRGPDNQTFEAIDESTVLGHVRLSIIDLNESSNQPFVDISGNFFLVFNGEIYNYLELKIELQKLGYSFKTSSDTEVLLYSYIAWGAECVNKFNGMWSFAIFDKLKNLLFCSRDRFGVKPFNYSIVNNQFIFSSEIKAIIEYFPNLRVPNYNVIANYCRTSLGAQIKETWFKDVFRLQPAHNLIIQNGIIEIKKYWDYPRKVNRLFSFDEAKNKYLELFKDSLRLRMRSDVPVGFTLSSGIDSSSIVSSLKGQLNNNNKTYTASFSNSSFSRLEKQNFKDDIKIDEPELVLKLAQELNLNPKIVEVDYDNYVDKLQKLIWHMESGHGSPAVFPLNAVLNVAKKDVTVILEGQGADELLGGYISNIFPIYFLELIKKLQFQLAIRELKEFSKTYSLKTSFMLFIRESNSAIIQKLYFSLSKINSFYSNSLKRYRHIKDYPIEPSGFDNDVNNFLFKCHTGGLVNLLHYGDAISMAHSLESRLPFMDYRLVEFVFSLPSSFKVRMGLGKFIHREAMRNIVPDFILNNPIKFGFDSPLLQIFSHDGENSASDILLSKRCMSRGLFSENEIKKAIKLTRQGSKNYSRYLYRMLSVELWFRSFIDTNISIKNKL